MKRIAARAHRSNYPNPISLAAGDIVDVDGGVTSEYPGWLWIRTPDGNAGWAPESMLIVTGDGRARATAPYTAKELDTKKGEVLAILRKLSGWCWVRNGRGEEGWVPAETTREA